MKQATLTTLHASALALASLLPVAAAGCVFDEHIDRSALPRLEQVALSLDLAESEESRAQLMVTCDENQQWVDSGAAGRAGDLIVGICTKALEEDDWSSARSMMLDLFPRAERQRHL